MFNNGTMAMHACDKENDKVRNKQVNNNNNNNNNNMIIMIF